MSSERVYPLDPDALELFTLKGIQAGYDTPRTGNANAVKVRRVMQIIRDFSKLPFDQLQILDLGCGEGVYAIEAALRGAEVVALDARTERMNEGAKAAERLGLKNLRFEQNDIRKVTVDSHGTADIVLFLGVLYHFDEADIFPILRNIHDMCRHFVVIDTHIALGGQHQAQYNAKSYQGVRVREHAETDTAAVRQSRLMASLDNPFSFRFTKESLFRLLADLGFTTVCECNVPLEPFKPENRLTIIAAKGEPVKLSSYPWLNDKSEEELNTEIKQFLDRSNQLARQWNGTAQFRLKQFAKSTLNSALRPFGLEIRQI